MSPHRFLFAVALLAACGGEGTPPAASVVNVSETKTPPIATASSVDSAATAPAVTPARDEEGPVPVFADDPRIGPAGGVTVVVFVDLQCPHCKVAHACVETLAADASNVRVVWKHYPLSSHPAARPAAEAAQGVYKLAGGKAFAAFARKVLASSSPTRADFEQWAQDVGVHDIDTFRRGLDDGRWMAAVERDSKSGQALQILGVPTIFVGGERYQGETTVAGLKAAVAAAR